MRFASGGSIRFAVWSERGRSIHIIPGLVDLPEILNSQTPECGLGVLTRSQWACSSVHTASGPDKGRNLCLPLLGLGLGGQRPDVPGAVGKVS